MKDLDILLKIILLLYRESLLDVVVDGSKDLVLTILKVMNGAKRTQLVGGTSSVLDDLKDLIRSIINNGEVDNEQLVASLEVILKDKDHLINNMKKQLQAELTQGGLKRSILSLRRMLNNYYKEKDIKRIINIANMKLATNDLDGDNINDYINKLVNNLETLANQTKAKDPGIVDEQDIGDEKSLEVVIDKVKDNGADSSSILKTGWKELNASIGGGFRLGTLTSILALHYNYKSGMLQSLFCQFCIYNIPKVEDGKKPLIVYVSFEDNSEVYIEFMYRYLYGNEHHKRADLDNVTTSEMATYIKSKLSINGYHAKMIRVNPSEWTYKHLTNKMLEYEADGYRVDACIIDYLSKLPTTGCTQGPAGTDMRDMFNRIRNFFSSHNTCAITAHQISSAGKQLLRAGVTGVEFVKEIAGKGFSSDSSQIDQIIDAEFYMHKTKYKGKLVLAVQQSKFRSPLIIDDDKKFFTLPFPYMRPIEDNLNKKDSEMGDAITTDGFAL